LARNENIYGRTKNEQKEKDKKNTWKKGKLNTGREKTRE